MLRPRTLKLEYVRRGYMYNQRAKDCRPATLPRGKGQGKAHLRPSLNPFKFIENQCFDLGG